MGQLTTSDIRSVTMASTNEATKGDVTAKDESKQKGKVTTTAKKRKYCST